MASVLNFRTFLIGAVLAGVIVLYKPVDQRITTVGLRRPVESIPNIHGHEIKVIPDTLQCEDAHYHETSGLLFAACQSGNELDRYSWFPPLGLFGDHKKASGGGLYVIDPKTFKSTQLRLEDFPHPLVTHGVDIVDLPGESNTIQIFAVNHLPNPAHYLADGKRNESEPNARSQIEIFKHTIGSKTASHVRSVLSPLITTPNDVLATSPTGFYVTNDHYYRTGAGRMLEDALTRGLAPWSNIIYVTLTDATSKDPEVGFYASQALRGLHNSNGLGHPGPARSNEVIVTDASGGVVYRLLRRGIDDGLQLLEEFQMPICLDNPSWYEDAFKTKGNDASGYVVNGLARGVDLTKYTQNASMPAPVQVYHVRADGKAKEETGHGNWEQRLIFSDDGSTPRTASAAVIVGIDPKGNGGKKQGWLFVTGFMSPNMIAAKIDL